jgi:Tol biopolymer transport system component
MTRPAIARLTVAVPLALAVLFSVPAQRGGSGTTIARAGMTSSLGADARLHRMSNGKIAFLRFADGSLGVINPDGSGLRRLALCCGISNAVWSPDGRRIAFQRDLSVYVMNANGSGQRRLVACGPPHGCQGQALAWSPTGTSLAIARGTSLYVLDLNTGRSRRLTAPVATPHSGVYAPADVAPAWSPDGSRIAFARSPSGCAGGCTTDPYVVNADGTGLKQLSSLRGAGQAPLWSPDGRTIAVVAYNRIYAVNPDGSHRRLLVRAPPMDPKQLRLPQGLQSGWAQALASWSSDGRHILYVRDSSTEGTALWITNANGTGQRRLYRASHGGNFDATFSPDGQLIAFSVVVARGVHQTLDASRSGVFVMSADGSHLHRLRADAGYEIAWQPIP